MCILELSKVLMYIIHYTIHGNNSTLLLTDTDSLMYEIKTEDILEYFNKDRVLFYFRNYSTKSK